MFEKQKQMQRDIRYLESKIERLNKDYWELNHKFCRLIDYLDVVEETKPEMTIFRKRENKGL